MGQQMKNDQERKQIRWRTETLLDAMFPALTMVFGLQMLRVLIPSVVLYKNAGSRVEEFGLFVFAPFVLALAAPWLPRLFGFERALIVSALGASAMRVALQLSADVNVRLWLAVIGVWFFLVFVPIYLGYTRRRDGIMNFGVVFLVGLTIDTALHGAWGTYDYVWQVHGGVVSLPFLFAATLSLVHALLRKRFAARYAPSLNTDRSFATALSLIAFGPLLMMNAIVLQNPAGYAAENDVPLYWAWIVVMLANGLGLYIAVSIQNENARDLWEYGLVCFAILLIGVPVAPRFLGAVIVFQAAAAYILIQLGRDDIVVSNRTGLSRTSIAWAVSVLLFVGLIILYYLAYDTKLPFENTFLFVPAGLIIGIGLISLWPSIRAISSAGDRHIGWRSLRVATVMVGVILIIQIVRPSRDFLSSDIPDAAFPVRIMSYNIHTGANADGLIDLEAIAQTIEASGADIVGLQEVPRGWYINASMDAVDWLAHRLKMNYVFYGAADPVWGNGILSRFPLPYFYETGTADLPEGNVRPRRSIIWEMFRMEDSKRFGVFVTHLHHANAEVRLLQVPDLLDEVSATGFSGAPWIILGDLNARPDTEEIDLFHQAGLRDTFELTGSGDGYTYRSNHPDRRIDYIWISPDLTARDFEVIQSTASDHLGIAVTIDKATDDQ